VKRVFYPGSEAKKRKRQQLRLRCDREEKDGARGGSRFVWKGRLKEEGECDRLGGGKRGPTPR